MNKRFLNVNDISGFLNVSINTIYSWVSQGRIPFIKCGHLVRFDISQIEQWIKKNTFVPDEDILIKKPGKRIRKPEKKP